MQAPSSPAHKSQLPPSIRADNTTGLSAPTRLASWCAGMQAAGPAAQLAWRRSRRARTIQQASRLGALHSSRAGRSERPLMFWGRPGASATLSLATLGALSRRLASAPAGPERALSQLNTQFHSSWGPELSWAGPSWAEPSSAVLSWTGRQRRLSPCFTGRTHHCRRSRSNEWALRARELRAANEAHRWRRLQLPAASAAAAAAA